MFKKIFFIFTLIIIFLSVIAAKPKKSDRDDIDRLLLNKNYAEAIVKLNTLLQTYPDDPEFNFMLGLCYFHTEDDAVKTIDQLEKAQKITSKKNLLIEIRYYLGRAYHVNAMFNKAIDEFNALKEMLSARNERMISEVDRLIESSNYAKRMCANPISIEIESLGTVINSNFDDHSPCLSADERYLVFTSRRKGKFDEKAEDGQYYEDIYTSVYDGYEWITPTRIDAFSAPGHDASVSISADGRTMLIFRSEKGDKKSSGGDIYISYRMGDKWTEPSKLGGDINTENRETHAAISPDGKTIYFSSDRPGGEGGLDIYSAKKDSLGKWGDVENLGDVINTKYDEQCPYVHVDGTSLYFSSNGRLTVGGLDIFVSNLADGKWSKPTNLGYPINSLRDDVFYVPTADGKRAYFASARRGGSGGLDLYMMTLKDAEARKLFVIRGAVGDAEKDPSFGDYRIIVKTSGKEDRVYRPDPVNGEYLFVVEADKVYSVDYIRDSYETMQTAVKMPYAYYNNVNHGIIPLQRVKLNQVAGRYIASDFAADMPGCGFGNAKTLPEIKGKIGTLKILNLGSRVEQIETEIQEEIEVPKPVVAPRPVYVDNTVYTVQIMAMTYNYPIRRFGRIFRDVETKLGKDGIYRYVYKKYYNFQDARADMLLMRRNGYVDAFVREYIDGELGKAFDDLGPRRLEANISNSVGFEEKIYYAVQIGASRRRLPMSMFRGISDDVIEISGGVWYRYFYKKYSTIEEANKGKYIMRRRGYRDAFVRKIVDGKAGDAVREHEGRVNTHRVSAKEFIKAKKEELKKSDIEILRK